jgi:hypothetical protein
MLLNTLLLNTPSLCPSLNVRDQVSHPYGHVLEIQVTQQCCRISWFVQNQSTHLMTTSQRVETSRLQHKIHLREKEDLIYPQYIPIGSN